MTRARVLKDDPAFRNPTKFQSSDPPSFSALGPSSTLDPAPEAPPRVDAAIEAGASQAAPEACPETDAAQTEIDCNAEAAAI